MKLDEFKKAVDKGIMPVAHTIAMDGVCVVVHPSNPVAKMTGQQVHDIYTGKITNWKDLGGPDKPIVVISRDTSSGTYEVFNEKVMARTRWPPAWSYVASNPQVQGRVSSTDGAIGYVGLGFVDKTVKALEVDGVAPNRKTVAVGQVPNQPAAVPVHQRLPGAGIPAQQFVAFYLSEKGQKMIEDRALCP